MSLFVNFICAPVARCAEQIVDHAAGNSQRALGNTRTGNRHEGTRAHTHRLPSTPSTPCKHKDINGFSMEASWRPGISWITGTRLPCLRKTFYQCNRPRVAAINSRRLDGNFSPQRRTTWRFCSTPYSFRSSRHAIEVHSRRHNTLRVSRCRVPWFSFSFVRFFFLLFFCFSSNTFLRRIIQSCRQMIRSTASARNKEGNRAQEWTKEEWTKRFVWLCVGFRTEFGNKWQLMTRCDNKLSWIIFVCMYNW